MPTRRVGVKLPMTDEPAQWPLRRSAGEWGSFVESLGYHSIWASEGWGADVFVTLTEIACRTDDIQIGSAIANVFSRSPAVLAMASSSLDRISGGRALLGVGASHKATVEEIHGLDFERPVRRVHETIEAVSALTRGGDAPVSYDGQLFSLHNDHPVDVAVPIYNAALGEANLRATGRVADGWLPHLVPFSRYEDTFETVAAAARSAGRNPDSITVAPQVLAAVGEDPEESRRLIRRFVADYVGRKPAYRNKIGRAYPDKTSEIASAWETDGVDAAELVSDEMVEDLGVAGTAEHARERLRNLVDLPLVDCPIVFVPKQATFETVERTLEQLRPDRL